MIENIFCSTVISHLTNKGRREIYLSKGLSRRCNFAPWDKGQCPHRALSHTVPGCCKCFQQCRIAPKCPNSRSPSYPTLLEALATPWDSVGQCSMGTLSLVPRSKVASSGQTLTVHRQQSVL